MTKRKDPKDLQKRGRKSKYKPEYCQAMIDFFNVAAVDDNGDAIAPRYVFEFADSIGVHHDTLHEWCSKHPEFSVAYNEAREYQKRIILNNAMLGYYNPSITWKMMMNMFGWRNKEESELTGKDGKDLLSFDALDSTTKDVLKDLVAQYAAKKASNTAK
jgi:hypothetical protein